MVRGNPAWILHCFQSFATRHEGFVASLQEIVAPSFNAEFKRRGVQELTMKMSLTKKPMKPMTTNPSAVLEQILLNSTSKNTQCLPSKLTAELYAAMHSVRNSMMIAIMGQVWLSGN